MSNWPPPFADDSPVPQARPVSAGSDVPVASPVSANATADANPLKLEGVPARLVWRDIAVMLGGLIALDFVVSILLKEVVPAVLPATDDRVLNVWGLLIRGAAWAGFIALLVRSRGLPLASVGVTTRRLGVDILLGWPTAGVAYGAFLVIALTLYALVPGLRSELESNALEITKLLPPMSPAGLVTLQLAVGAYEELVFRGFLLTRLRRGLRSWTAATVISSAIFAVLHLSSQKPVAAIPIFALGLVFCGVVIWRRSLVPAIIGHALFNAAQLLYIHYTVPEWK